MTLGKAYQAVLSIEGIAKAALKGPADGSAKSGAIYFHDGGAVYFRQLKRPPKMAKPKDTDYDDDDDSL